MTSPEPESAGARRWSALSRAVSAHQEGRAAEAESLYGELLAADAADADVLNFLGVLRSQQGRTGESEQLIRASLRSAPSNAHAWNNLGNVLFATGREAEAADAYLRAVELDIELGAPWRNLGECLERSGSPERAIELFRHIIETVPGFVPAYEALGRVLRVLGRRSEAIEVYRRWVELEPGRATARHMLAAATEEAVPARASDEYVQELFDGFAADFDDKLARLKYCAPALVSRALGAAVPAGVAGVAGARLRILDAGCGTGLCGPLLRPLAAELVGVDLSSGMLRRAAARGSYDRLEQAELTGYLSASAERFEAIACVDTLCYFGALEPAFAAAHQALRPGGCLAFSVERLPDGPAESSAGSPESSAGSPDYRIAPHGRYQHARRYLERTLVAAGYAVVSLEDAVLREEVLEAVHGLIAVARKV